MNILFCVPVLLVMLVVLTCRSRNSDLDGFPLQFVRGFISMAPQNDPKGRSIIRTQIPDDQLVSYPYPALFNIPASSAPRTVSPYYFGPFRVAEADYKIFENGVIQTSGHVAFEFMNGAVDIPFQNTYHANPEHVRSERYRLTTFAGQTLRLGRLDVEVIKIRRGIHGTRQVMYADIVARLAAFSPKSDWRDLLYGFDRIEATLDVTGDLIKIVAARVIGGWSFFDHDRPQSGYLPNGPGITTNDSKYYGKAASSGYPKGIDFLVVDFDIAEQKPTFFVEEQLNLPQATPGVRPN